MIFSLRVSNEALNTKCQIICTYNKSKRRTEHERDRKLVVAFMDFEMAYDRVDRRCKWEAPGKMMWVGICSRSDPRMRTYAFVFVKGESVEGKFWFVDVTEQVHWSQERKK